MSFFSKTISTQPPLALSRTNHYDDPVADISTAFLLLSLSLHFLIGFVFTSWITNVLKDAITQEVSQNYIFHEAGFIDNKCLKLFQEGSNHCMCFATEMLDYSMSSSVDQL